METSSRSNPISRRDEDQTASLSWPFGRMWLLLLAVVVVSTGLMNGCATIGKANDPNELDRTLNLAIIAIPKKYLKSGVIPNSSVYLWRRLQNVKHELSEIVSETNVPLVIYLHGCGGLGPYARDDILFLLHNNYAVLAPNSFAREYKPKSCDPATCTGGLHRDVLYFRLAEAKHAHEAARSWPWVDTRNIFMMGLSEGGWTTAKYGRGGLAGRIIIGATCHSGWPERRGLSGPLDEPILAIVASRDPWYKHPGTWGD